MKTLLMSISLLLSHLAFAQTSDQIKNVEYTLKNFGPILSACQNEITSTFNLSVEEIISIINVRAEVQDRIILKGEHTVKEKTAKEKKKIKSTRLMLIGSEPVGILEVLGKAAKWEKGLKLAALNGQCIQLGSYSSITRGNKLFGTKSATSDGNFFEAIRIENFFEKFWNNTEF